MLAFDVIIFNLAFVSLAYLTYLANIKPTSVFAV